MSKFLLPVLLLSSVPFFSFLKIETNHPSFPYDLDQPNVTFELPESLKEISGLSMTADGAHLAAVNDEEGIIFILDKVTGQILQQVPFGDGGDYEGIEIAGKDAWVIKSSGTLYQIKNYASDQREVHKFKSFLNKENDVEGLAFDPLRKSLLIGCKGKGMEGEDNKLKKAIYEFRLSDQVMLNDPVYLLTLPDFQEYLAHLEGDDHQETLQEIFTPEEGEMKFSPSGIAVHPLTGDIYVTSSKGKLLGVLNREGHILYLEKLKKKTHPQPEGICFDAEGTLYIANEGKDNKARIYKFLYRK
jgi:uncharacterized protein YjiK